MRTLAFLSLIAVFAQGSDAKDLSIQAMRAAEGFTWVERTSPNFDFFVESGTAAARDLDAIVQLAETGRVAIEKLLGSQVRRRLAVFIVPSRTRMKDLTDKEMNGFATGTAVFVFYESAASHGVGRHEFCHVLALYAWGGLPKNEGINEGLAVYSDDQWQGLQPHLVAKTLLNRHQLVPLGALLQKSLGPYPEMISYPELGSFVKFVYESYGRNAVKTLWQRGVENAPRAFKGKTLVQVESEWRAMLGKLDASSIHYDFQPAQ